MNYNEALDYIHSLQVFGSIPGLERISKLLEKLSNPQDKLKFIHVAGTNGKGSVCTMLSEIYNAAGYKTGLYTSPYVVDFRERIQLGGKYIEKEDLARLCQSVKDTGIQVTEFEFITALAFLYYAEQGCDLVILETGLGGRFDATNVIKAPLCSVIMKIDYDHTAYLGDTLSQIAMEKCGIIKDGCPVVSYPLQEDEALNTIKEYADNLVLPDISKLEIQSTSITGNAFTYNGVDFSTKLIGKHQVYNAMTAIEAVNAAGLSVSMENIKDGITTAVIPARLELISQKPTVFLDGAHNPNGADAISSFMKNYDGEIIAIVGMMADKNCEDFLKNTVKYCKSVITVTVRENPRTISAEDLAKIASNYCNDVLVADSYDEAILKADKKSGKKLPIFVFGSLYLAGSVRPKLISYFNT